MKDSNLYSMMHTEKFFLKKIVLFCLLGSAFLTGCSYFSEPEYPSITNTSFTIIINDEYDVIQSSASTCNFVKDEKIADMKIIVEKVDKLNWNDQYVILSDADKNLYIYDMDTCQLENFSSYNDFLEAKQETGTEINLEKKDSFTKTP